jgi:hemolysin III
VGYGTAGYGSDMTGKPHVVEATQHTAEQVGDHLAHALEELKPKLRGWLHAVSAPLTLAAGIVLVALSPTTATRIGSTIFLATSGLLFTVSAIYHRGTWNARTWSILQRFDHANIFLLIAGSYTPFALVMLEGSARTTLLALAWGGALAGVASRLLWQGAPRWFYTPIYIALGWAAVFYVDDFLAHGSTAVFVLIATGGLLYTIGGVVYGLKRPNPSPTWFGFHEVFHSFTILAFITHYVGVSLATYSLR